MQQASLNLKTDVKSYIKMQWQTSQLKNKLFFLCSIVFVKHTSSSIKFGYHKYGFINLDSFYHKSKVVRVTWLWFSALHIVSQKLLQSTNEKILLA